MNKRSNGRRKKGQHFDKELRGFLVFGAFAKESENAIKFLGNNKIYKKQSY